MRLVFRIKDVDLKDNFQSVENVNVAQPRNDDDDYSEEDESENEDDVQYVKDSEKAFPVLSKANAATRAVNVSFNILIFILSIYLQKLVYFRPKFDWGNFKPRILTYFIRRGISVDSSPPVLLACVKPNKKICWLFKQINFVNSVPVKQGVSRSVILPLMK